MNCRVVFIGRIENNETKMLLLFNIITLNTWNIYANNYVKYVFSRCSKYN